MKVLVVGTGGALGGSGITTMADQMTRTLGEMGHEPVRFVAGSRRRTRPNRLNLENVTAVFTEALSAARAARSNRVEVVWLHTFGVPTLPAMRALLQVVAMRLAGSPIIVQLHAFALAEQVQSGSWALRVALRMVGRLSRRVVVLQDADAQALRRLVAPESVTILPNWVDVHAEPLPLPPGPPINAVFVGGLVERKGVPQLLEAMRLLADVPIHLRLVGGSGDDGEAAAAAMRASAADLVSSGRVTFVGELDRAAVRDEIADAHLLVLPSRAEGVPMAALEALALGRPVLVGDAGEVAQLVRRHRCGAIIPSQDAAAIAEVLRSASADPHLLNDQGRRGYELAIEHFSASAAADRLTKTLTRVR